MNFLIDKIRNKFESSRVTLSILDFLTRNKIYKKYIFHLFQEKVALIEENRRYSFTIEVTSICNARCTFCPNSVMKRLKGVMSDEVFLKIVDRIKEEKIEPTFFNLGPNGEPLIDKKIFKRIEILAKNFPKAKVQFPTNLSLATKEIQQKLVESKLDNICVSLNANNVADYKKIMNLDFKTTIKNLESLIKLRNKTKSKLKIYLKLAANPVNKASIDKFLKRWKNKVDGVGISWIHSWAGAVDNGDSNESRVVKYPCRTLFEQINIHANGNIPLCCVDYEGKIIGGNVMKDKILDSINSPKIRKIKDLHREGKIDQIKMCSQCRFCERGLYWLV